MSKIFERVTDTLKAESISSSEAAGIIEVVRQEMDGLNARVSEIEAQALDPLTDQAQALKLRREREEARFLIDRLSAGLARLEEVHADAVYREEQGRCLEAYEAAANKMADLEQALSSRWPQLAKELRLLLTASLEALIEVQKVNQDLPDGKPPIPIPTPMLGEKPLYKEVTIPGYWRAKVDSLLYDATPSGILKINQ